MKASDLFEALGRLDDETILEVVSMVYKEKHGIKGRKAFRTLLIAAVIVSVFAALGIAAYAGDFLGIRALLQGREIRTDGQALVSISITQPQQLPEDIPADIKAKIENCKAAWQEWISPPEFIGGNAPEEYDALGWEKNDDGSYTCTYFMNGEMVKEAVFSAEEFNIYKEEVNVLTQYASKYDSMYGVCSEYQEKKLERIASDYGLKLRGEASLAWSSETTGQTGENFYTNAQLCAMTADMGNSGSIFVGSPTGFDKVYWYDEGSFCVSYYVNLPSSGEEVTCYLRNSMYTTLTSGSEVGIFQKADESFNERKYTSADGTELTILSNGKFAYIYAYLDNSYMVEHISGTVDPAAISDSDLDYIAEFINYSVIGKG